MTEEQQDVKYTREWLEQKLEADRLAEEKSRQEHTAAVERERLLASWKATGGDEASFEKEYPKLVAERRRTEAVELDQAHRHQAARQGLQRF